MRIGPGNAEVLFEDQRAWELMPDMRRYRDQWALSRMSPALKPTGTRAVLDFLEAAGPEHERALSGYFGERVTIDKLDYRSVRSVEFHADDPSPLEGLEHFTGFCTHRKGDTVRLTTWR